MTRVDNTANYYLHLDLCEECSPTELCAIGQELLAEAAEEPRSSVIAKVMQVKA